MFKLNKAIAVAAAIPMATLVVVGLTAGPASADPAPPTGAVYCGSGSDTTQDVMQKLSEIIVSSSGKKFESWNARGTSPITTNCAAGSFARPDGSGAGITALRDSLNLGGEGTGPVPANALTFARSSRGPNDTSNTDLTFIPFGIDAVAPAVKSGGGLDQKYPSGLTIAQLQDIYKCVTKTITVGSTTYTIAPYVPQANSGTRSFWLTAVGITEADVNKAPASGGCVRDTKISDGSALQEHDGTVLTDPTVGTTLYTEIIPISIAQNIAQTNHVTTGVTDRRGSSKLLSLASQAPIVSGQINASWPSAYQRSVYNVFKTTSVTGLTADPALKEIFVSNSALVCTGTPKSTINLFGFLTNANCGDTSVKGKK
ncbi:hypothetical protein ABT369_20820 [Dactylosporangium sp. NPDC000244]|uniref:hypothetical protein n=1 Tax=Dactylosporangium sp. NPDC000244 TaxID=3154365 RepID=UPI0033224D85